MPFRESFETFNGCRTRLMRGGEGPPLLYLHGAGGAGIWLPFMEKLSQRFDLIVPEHPGFGGTDMPEWLDNVGDVAYFYLDVIDALGLDRVHLAGSSMGGWIAAEIAVRDCHKLATLTLSAAVGIRVKGVQKGDIFLWSREQLLRNLFHDPKFAEVALAMPFAEAEQMTYAKNQLAAARLGWHPRLYNPHLAKWLHRIAVPTLVLWGADDKVVPAAHGPAFATLIPGARLEIFKDCGHLPQVERADAFVGKIVAFIDEVAS